jgi:hypothetical protein
VARFQSAAALVALLALVSSQSVSASSLSFSVRDGRVTVIANDVTVREILVEWQRVGQTVITNLDKLKGPRIRLELHDVPEATALAVLLRAVSGYVALPRTEPIAAGSVFKSILILASSSSPVPTAPVTARGPSPLAPGPQPLVSMTSPSRWPSPHSTADPMMSKSGPVAPAAVPAGSASPRFSPLSAVELAGARGTRQRQQEVLFGGNNALPTARAAPVSTDASRPGTITTTSPQQSQRPGTPRR